MGDDEWRKASTEEKVEHKVKESFLKTLQSQSKAFIFSLNKELESSCRRL